MRVRNIVPSGFLFICAIIAGVTPLHSADDPKPDAPPVEEKAVTKVYNVSTLVSVPDDFDFDTSPHSGAFIAPGNRSLGESGYGGGGGGGGAGLFREPGDPRSRTEQAERLTNLIMNTVAPETWRDNGGREGSLRVMHDMLIVTQTPTNHKEVAALLHQLTECRSQTVRITADWLLLLPAEVESFLKTGPGEKAHRAVREVDPAALNTLSASSRHFHAELMSRNGQTVHFISGRERTVTVTQIPSVGTDIAAYTPVIGNIADGIALAVNASVDSEEHSGLVTLFSTFNDGQEPGPPIAVRTAPATQGSSGRHDALSDASATYRELSGIVQEFRTTARIPLGVPVLVVAMTLEPSAKNAEARQLVLILRVQPVE